MGMLQLSHFNGVFHHYPKLLNPLLQITKDKSLFKQQAVPSRTQRIMEGITVGGEVGGAGGAYSYDALKRLDQIWSGICSAQSGGICSAQSGPQELQQIVSSVSSNSDLADKVEDKFDVVVCGGTLGIFIATALSARGLRVCIFERNIIKGREQEWNISKKELLELVEVGILSEDDIEQATSVKFNPAYLLHQACQIPLTKCLGKYLGVPLLHDRVNFATFAETVSKVQNKLSAWKASSLSLAGRMTLVNSVTSVAPIHLMQTNLLPTGTLESLDKLNRQFLWGSSGNARKIHCLPWDVVCKNKSAGGAGIREAKDMNKVLLMKLLWRIWKEPHSLWASVLAGKYKKDVLFGGTERIARDRSHLWKSIHSIYDDFTSGFSWSIGDGRTTDFWRDRWLDDLILRDVALKPIEDAHKDLKVAGFFDTLEGWRWEVLEEYFEEHILIRFHAVLASRDSDLRDMPRWCNSSNGMFSCRSAYDFITNDVDGVAAPPSFAILWKLKVPQRLKSFGWLCLHNRILTNAERRRRHLTLDSMCSRCNMEEESICHALRDCPLSLKVWKEIIPLHGWNDFMSIVSVNWFRLCFDLPDSSFGFDNWRTVFLFVTVSLWEWRNKLMFQSDFVFPFSAGKIIFQNLLQNRRCWDSLAVLKTSSPRMEKWLFWRRPPVGAWKLNSDGSRVGLAGLISAGGLIRDSNGNWISGFLHNIGSGSSFEAEIWGVLSGINLALELGTRKLEVESDCAEVVNLINDTCSQHHPARSLIRKIQVCMDRFEEIKISHVFREMNRCADFLATRAASEQLGVTVLYSAPDELKQLLIDDYQGVALPRMIAT